MKRVALSLLIPVLAACSGAPASTPTPEEPATVTASGTIDVPATLAMASLGDPCTTRGGYTDIAAGTQVKILDADGKVLTFGNLGSGKAASNVSSGVLNACRFPFAVEDVPAGRGIYGVEVSRRGVVQVKEADLGAIALKLG